MFVDVLLFLKNVVKIPNFDASVDRRCENGVVVASNERLYFDDPLEMGCKSFHQRPIIHGPNDEFLANSRHGQNIALGENQRVGLIEFLANVPDPAWKPQLDEPFILHIPKLEAFLKSGVHPLLIFG